MPLKDTIGGNVELIEKNVPGSRSMNLNDLLTEYVVTALCAMDNCLDKFSMT